MELSGVKNVQIVKKRVGQCPRAMELQACLCKPALVSPMSPSAYATANFAGCVMQGRCQNRTWHIEALALFIIRRHTRYKYRYSILAENVFS